MVDGNVSDFSVKTEISHNASIPGNIFSFQTETPKPKTHTPKHLL